MPYFSLKLFLKVSKPVMKILWNICHKEGWPAKKLSAIRRHPTDCFSFVVGDTAGASLMDERFTKAAICQWRLLREFPSREIDFHKHNNEDSKKKASSISSF